MGLICEYRVILRFLHMLFANTLFLIIRPTNVLTKRDSTSRAYLVFKRVQESTIRGITAFCFQLTLMLLVANLANTK